jgi:hypothetical protein
MPPKFSTTADAAERSGITVRRMQQLCQEGKVPGATLFGRDWMVPATFKWTPQKPGPKSQAR